MSNLLSTPDFNGLPNLQMLKIFHCDELEEIHPSHGNHTSLEYVSVRFCKKLRMFPMNVQMKNLKVLELPKIQSKPSGECYTQLETVVHQFTRKMNLDGLQKLDLCGWGLKDGEIPSGIGELSNLEELNLSHNDFSLLGFSLSKLTRLKIILLSKCERLVELPELPSRIAVLKADYCESLITIGNNRHTNFKCLCEVSFMRKSRGIRNDAAVFFVETMLQCTRKMNPSSLQKLDLSSWGLKDGEIPCVIGELSNLEVLDLSDNGFSRLGFSLSKLTRLKILLLSNCKWLVELPELPSSIAVLKADYCDSLITIGNNYHTNFKCFCEVSFLRYSRGIVYDAGRLVKSIVIDAGRLVESMLQGMGIPKALLYLGRWEKCKLQLQENWYNDFCGFIIFAVRTDWYTFSSIIINIQKVMNDITSSDGEDDVDDVSFEKSIGGGRTTTLFVSFASLRHTSWWEETPNTLLFSFAKNLINGREVGIALVPTGTATDFHAFHTLNILDDSTSTLTIKAGFRSNDVPVNEKMM